MSTPHRATLLGLNLVGHMAKYVFWPRSGTEQPSFRAAYAAHPPNAVRLGGIDRPVPLGSIPPDARPEHLLYESMCDLTDQLRHND